MPVLHDEETRRRLEQKRTARRAELYAAEQRELLYTSPFTYGDDLFSDARKMIGDGEYARARKEIDRLLKTGRIDMVDVNSKFGHPIVFNLLTPKKGNKGKLSAFLKHFNGPNGYQFNMWIEQEKEKLNKAQRR